jgi:hypothetical protein
MNAINMKTQNNVIGLHDRLNLPGILKFFSKLTSTMCALQTCASDSHFCGTLFKS